MTMKCYNPYRDEESTEKHMGVKSQVQLNSAAILLACFVIGAIVGLVACLMEVM